LLFEEPRAGAVARKLESLDELFSAALFVAEMLATLNRENRPLTDADALLSAVSLVFPDQPLASECKEVLGLGYIRGADLLHLATAVFLAGSERERLLFVSLDEPQKRRASQLGFRVWPRS
jgi:PIN domain